MKRALRRIGLLGVIGLGGFGVLTTFMDRQEVARASAPGRPAPEPAAGWSVPVAAGVEFDVEDFAARAAALAGTDELTAEQVGEFYAEIEAFALSTGPRQMPTERLAQTLEHCATAVSSLYGTPGRTMVAYLSAECWIHHGSLERAEAALASVDPLDETARDARAELLAKILTETDRTDEALALLDRLAAELDPEDRPARARVEMIRAGALLIEGRLPDAAVALTSAEAALADLEPENDPELSEDRDELRLLQIGYATLEGQHAEAERILHGCLRELQHAGRAVSPAVLALFDVYQGTIEFTRERADPTRARRSIGHLQRAIDSGRLIPHTLRQAELRLAEIALADRDFGALLRHLDRLHALEPDRASPELRTKHAALLAGYLRSRETTPIEALRRVRDRLRAAFEAHREVLSRGLEMPGGKGWLHVSDRRYAMHELVELELAIGARTDAPDGGERAALEVLLRAQLSNSLAATRRAEDLDVAGLQRELLRDGHGAIVYLIAKGASHVFAVDRTAIVHERLADEIVLEQAAVRFVEQLRGDPASAYLDRHLDERLRKLSAATRELILPPSVLARIAAWQGVTVVGAEFLQRLPFAALLLPAPWEGRLFGEVFAIDEVESLPLAMCLLSDRRKARAVDRADTQLRLALLANTATGSGAVRADRAIPFPIDDPSTMRILSSYAPAAREQLVDGELTLAAARARDWSLADVTHVVAHGVQRGSTELGAGLALSDADFTYEDLDAETTHGLLLIGACSASQSAARLGDSAIASNLGGAWVRRGGSAVMASQIPIALGPHLALTADVHERLVAGASPAHALLTARERRAGDDWVRRFQDAQYQIFGLGQYPLR